MKLFSDRIPGIFRKYYPELVNGAIHPLFARIIRQWIKRYPIELERVEYLESLRRKLQSQSQLTPSPQIYQRVKQQLPTMAEPAVQAALPWQYWLIPLLFLVLAAVMLRQALPPVIAVNWSAQGKGIESFRVYRTNGAEIDFNGSAEGRLVYEISVNNTDESYGFVDLPLLPTTEIAYRIDALGKDGLLADTTTWVSDGLPALISQLLFLTMGILAGYIVWSITLQMIVRSNRRNLDLA